MKFARPKVFYVGVILLLALISGYYIFINYISFEFGEQTTEPHSQETELAIVNYLLNWTSIEARNNADLRSELATGQWLAVRNDELSRIAPDETIVKITNAVIHELQVLEYSQTTLKATACISQDSQLLSSKGEKLEDFSSEYYCSIFVFWKEEKTWKLAGTYSLAEDARRYWKNAPAWLHEVIGELPEI